MIEKQYQTITLKETQEQFVVDIMEYPFQQAGILYLKFFVYNDDLTGYDRFLTVQPQDILSRVHPYTKEEEEFQSLF